MQQNEESSKYLRIIVKTSVFVFFSAVLSKVLSYVYKIIVARNFGAEQYGLFSLATIFVGVFCAVFTLGLPEAVTRFVPFYEGKGQHKNANYLMRRTLTILVIAGFIGGLSLFLSAYFLSSTLLHKPDLTYFLQILSISVPFTVIAAILLGFLRANNRIKTYSFLSVPFLNGLKVLLLFALLLFGLQINALLFSYILSYAVLLLAALFFVSPLLGNIFSANIPNKETRKTITNNVFSYSWPLIFTGLIYSLYYWVDSLIIGYFMSAQDVGYYNVAIPLATFFTIAQDLFLQIFLPLISLNLSKRKYGVIRDITKQITKWTFAINAPFFIIFLVFPEAIINILFGEAYLPAVGALRILSAGALFSGFIGLFMNLISAKGRTRLVLQDFIVFVFLNFVLGTFLVHRFGINGVALATTISWFFFGVTLAIQVRNLYGFVPFKRDVLRVSLAMVLPAIFLIVASRYISSTMPHLLSMGFLFIAIYVGSLLLIRALDRNDLMILKAVQHRIPLVKSFLNKRTSKNFNERPSS